MRSTAVAASITIALAATLTGCGGGGKKNQSGSAEICVDKNSRKVASDQSCVIGATAAQSAWYYTPHKCGQPLPFFGQQAPGGSFDKPRKGKVQRGGFGQCTSKSSS